MSRRLRNYLCRLVVIEEPISVFQLADQQAKKHERQTTTPHISNLNYDPQLSGRILYFVEEEPLTIGNGKDEGVKVVLKGPR